MKIFIFVTIPLRTTSISVKRPQFEIHHFRDEPSFDISKNPVHLILPANKNESKMQSVSFKLRAIIPPPPCLVSITNERVRRRNGGGSKDQHEVIISRTKGAHNAPPLPFSLSLLPSTILFHAPAKLQHFRISRQRNDGSSNARFLYN